MEVLRYGTIESRFLDDALRCGYSVARQTAHIPSLAGSKFPAPLAQHQYGLAGRLRYLVLTAAANEAFLNRTADFGALLDRCAQYLCGF